MKKVGVGKFTLGAVLIILGLAFALQTTGTNSRAVQTVLNYWPVVFIMLGVEFLLAARDKEARTRLSVLAVFGIAFVMFAACVLNYGPWIFAGWDWGWGAQLSESYVVTVPVNEGAESLEAIDAIKVTGSGHVQITGSSDSAVAGNIEISVRARSYSEAKEIAEDLRANIKKSGTTLIVEGPRPSGLLQIVSVRVNTTLSVPENWDVDVQSAAGDTEITGIKGELKVRASAGNVTLDGLAEKVDVQVSAGHCWATLGPDMQSFEGNVSAGNLNLTIPDGVGAIVEASSSAGGVQCSLPGISVKKSGANARASGRIGSGACQVDVRTSAGNVTIR
ncbi:MAG TPA: DUF4097 domain-containing protein [Firmicutes bacterium]|nr:DUF4097 domain-containing protein [Candidatus Fermentithermobacillaceae bacterium]